MAEHDQQFDSFEQWVDNASSWLTNHTNYLNTEYPTRSRNAGYRGPHFTAICFDTQGRRCRNGEDFMRARDEGTFPVRWVWPDQVIELIMQGDLNARFIEAVFGKSGPDENSKFMMNGVIAGDMAPPWPLPHQLDAMNLVPRQKIR